MFVFQRIANWFKPAAVPAEPQPWGPMETLAWLESDEQNLLGYLKAPRDDEHVLRLLSGLAHVNVSLAQWKFKVLQDPVVSAQKFYTAARVAYCYTQVSARSPGWEYADVNDEGICNALLSGDQATLDLFLREDYPIKDPGAGWSSSWMAKCIRYGILGDDIALAELVRTRPHKDFQSAADFFKALLAGDAEACAWAIFELLAEQKKEHGGRTGELLSPLACALAKLAKGRGLSLELDKLMVPPALLEEIDVSEYPNCDYLLPYYG